MTSQLPRGGDPTIRSRRSRIIKLVLLGIAAVLAALALAVLASAAFDRPSKTIQSEVTVRAPIETVWRILTDVEDYDRWNPSVTNAEGDVHVGAELDLELQLPDGATEEIRPEVVVIRPDRKLRWQSRTFSLPGIADREYEAIIEPLDGGLVRVVQSVRFEGLLVPLIDAAQEQAALDLAAEALEQTAEAARVTPSPTWSWR